MKWACLGSALGNIKVWFDPFASLWQVPFPTPTQKNGQQKLKGGWTMAGQGKVDLPLLSTPSHGRTISLLTNDSQPAKCYLVVSGQTFSVLEVYSNCQGRGAGLVSGNENIVARCRVEMVTRRIRGHLTSKEGLRRKIELLLALFEFVAHGEE